MAGPGFCQIGSGIKYVNSGKHSLQDTYAPDSACFGCGPANKDGLHLQSYPNIQTQTVEASWTPQPKYEAFPNVLNGGIIGALLDCHANWAAAWFLMQDNNLESPPPMVTAEYTVKLLRPTPTVQDVQLRAQLDSIDGKSVMIQAELIAEGKIRAKFTGRFVAVEKDHPGYNRNAVS